MCRRYRARFSFREGISVVPRRHTACADYFLETFGVRVLFNGVTLLKPRTGIAHAAANVHAALAAAHPDDTFYLYPGSAIAGLAARAFKPNTGAPVASKKPGALKALARRALGGIAKAGFAAHFQTVARLGRFDLYHEPNFVPFRTGLPLVVTVFDLSVLLFPQWHPAERVKAHEATYKRGLALADHVIVGTEAVRREALQHLGLHPDRVTAMLCGIGPQFRPQAPATIADVRARYELPARYTLYVGTIEPRKNVGTLLRAFCALPSELREACPLVLAGGWGWKTDTERELFERDAKPRGARHIGYVPDADLPALYAGAEALLYPSFYEGFGMPPVEAMACGTAAVASLADAVREAVGRAALTIDASDEPGWHDALKRIASDRDFLSEYRKRGPAHAATFTWAKCAATVYGAYQKALGRAPVAGQNRRAA